MEKPILRSSSKPEIPRNKQVNVSPRPQSALHEESVSPSRGSWYSSYLRALSQKKREPTTPETVNSVKSATLYPSSARPAVGQVCLKTISFNRTIGTKKEEAKSRAGSAVLTGEKKRMEVSGSVRVSTAAKLVDYLTDYRLGLLLGQGAFATVRSAIDKLTNASVAIKTYEKYRLIDVHQKNAVAREIKILSQLNHDHIVKLKKVIDTPKQLHLVMEQVVGTSLFIYLKQKETRRLPEGEAKLIFGQFLGAVEYLHSRSVAHRDIKLQNVLVDEKLNVTLIDFGCATEGSSDLKTRVYCGTPNYMAPEIIERKAFRGCQADVWAAGILLYSLLCGEFPFKGINDRSLSKKIQTGVFSFPPYLSAEAKGCITAMLAVDPDIRPSSRTLMDHPWLTISGCKSMVGEEGLRPATTPMLMYQRGNAFSSAGLEPDATYKRLLEIRTS